MPSHETTGQNAFDFIIAGGGSAGCVLANRLSENPANRVCLIEAGGNDKSLMITVPLGITFLIDHPAFNWRYRTAKQPNAANREIRIPRGRALGGSSSINGMVYSRGHPLDYDEWAEVAGCTGWSYKEVLPYFKRSERNERFTHDSYHGTGGPLNVSDLKKPNPLVDVLFQAADSLQIPRREDFNGADQEGVGFRQVTIKNGRRHSAANAYLDPVKNRPNLIILTNAVADKVILDGTRATGLEILQNGERKTVKALREVIVCCGSIVSPAVLMRSGIGDPTELARHGIAAKHALNGVGKNLQEHAAVSLCVKSPSVVSYGVSLRSLPRLTWHVIDYLLNRVGLLASNVNEATIFLRSLPGLSRPDVQFGFTPAMRVDTGRKIAFGHGISMNASILRPKSRGTITLRDTDPTSAPVIDPRFFDVPDDLDTLVRAVTFCRRILHAPAFDPYRGEELRPGPAVQTDEQIAQFVRDNAATVYHPVGTCAMGTSESAVVDTQLRVKGIEGLRVVDASVMPLLIGGNTNAPTIMIAEKAADMILGKPPLPPEVPPEAPHS
ncbi:MAG: choline dehydrogenase [Rhodospirillales bacterium]